MAMQKEKEVKDDKFFVNYAKDWFDNQSRRGYNCSKTWHRGWRNACGKYKAAF